jgi:hypothetical protein
MRQIILILFLLSRNIIFSQVGIDISSPDASSILHINGNGTKGLLLPRLTTAQSNAASGILSPVGGIVFYDLTKNCLMISLESGKWKNACTGAEINTTSGTTTSTGNIGIGTTSLDKNALLEVVSTTKGVLLPTAATDIPAVAGMLYYNTTSNTVKIYTGSVWLTLVTN